MSESRRRLDTTLKGRATTTLLAVAAVLMAFVGALALPSIAASQGISPTATITPGDIGPPTATPTPTMPLDGLDGDDNEEQVKGLFFEIEGDPPPSPDIDTLASRLAGIDFAQLDPSLESVSRPMGSDEVSRLTPQTVSLNLFDDATFTGRIEHVEPTSSGYAFWGGIDGVELGTMTMVVNGDIVVGTVRTPGGVFTVETADSDAYVIRQIDESTLPLLAEPLESLPDSDKGLRQTLGDSVPMDDGSVIDLMAVYTPAAKSLFGGRAGIEALIDLYVAETNQAYASSGAFQRIRLVLREEVDYVESSWDDIGRLEGDSDGYMDHVHELRDAYAADLVHLIFATNEEYEYAGVANFEGSFGASLAAPWAGWVFAHELGHNMGLHHDRYQLMHERGTETIEGSFFGYVNQRAFESDAPESTRWRTIMSYDRQCGEVLGTFCRQLLFFSNPRLTHGGDPMGVSVDNPSTGVDGPADAVRTLNERRGITANFRRSASSTPRVGLVLSRYRLSEKGETGTATATLHKPSSENTKVTISAWPTGAVTLSKDRTLIIPAGRTVSVGVVTITTVDNDDQSGSVKVTVSAAVTNASEEGVVAPHSVTLYVIDDDTDIAPAFEAGSVAYTFTAGEEDIRTLPEATGGNGSLTYSISPEPGNGVTFVSGPPARLEVSATSVASGETNYTLTATDSDGDTDEMTVSITVRSPNCAGSVAVSGYSDDGIVADCEVLLASRDALRAEQSLNWSEDLSIDEWEGVGIGSDRVVDLTIGEYGLSGSLPAELGDLTHLKTLTLSHNELSGPIPPELGSLSRLETLWLGKSQLTGRIPPELGNLSSLETLWLGSNQLIGRIPSELGNLSNLETLWLDNNRLSGPIPPELGSLSRLETLWLAFSELSGPIPPELGGLSNLEFLWLGDNQLTGRIPPELGDLANLKKLYLDNNRLSGPIPPELNKLTSLEQLYIGGNQFSGCAADVLFDVPVNDLRESGIRSCNEQLSGLTISPGSLVPPFNPDHTSYTAVVGQAQITISPTYGSNVTLQILDQDGNAIVDADRSLAGHQIDLDAGVTVVSLRLSTREGNETSGHYTIWVNRASAPGAPVIEGITPGGQSLTVAWNAPAETGGADIASYDLRYIESGSADKSDDNWTVIADAWTRGPRRYTITGLDADTSYDAQVRAVHGAGAGPWSETSSGTPIALAGTCLEYITGPIIIYGTWDGECESTVRTGSYARFYTFTLGELKEMAITLESEADTYLYVREGEGPDGHIVYDDDDDDHLMFNLTSSTDSGISESIESGTYTIEATTHDPGKRGTFTLTLPEIDFSEQNDRAALVALYQATNGHNWANRTNWLTYAPLGEWHGVATDSSGRVTGLALVQNRLSGHIPPELADLATIESIDLRINGLTGEIPARLGELAELESLDLGLNLLEGTIPEELAKQSNLKSLNLAGNNLSGTIPPELGSLDNLEYLNLAVNGLTGEIPHELGNLDQLESLRLHNNQLSGTIPPELSNLGSLAELLLLENLLAGPLPPELGKLSNLEFLDISFNKLTGTIPPEFGDLASLGALFLYRNELSGMIPSELSNLSNLHGLNLNNNSLSGTIPPELGDMPNLVSLHVNDNELSGEIPPELGKSPSLGFLVLNNNQLSGQIPSELGNLENLIALFVADNQLTGCIPYTLRDVQENDFDQLDLPFCENPDRAALVALYHATNGQSWDESDNWLTDAPLDDWDHVRTDDYGRVVDLSLGGNDLIGHIPPELGDLSELKFLELDGNLLTGTLPPELGKLVNLVELFLEENRLTGTIPSEFGNLVALERLYLNENRFWGELPFSMTALSELRRFEFDDNSAGLCAPADAGFQEWLNSVEDVDGDTCVHPTSPPDEREIAALTAIYNATDGDNWYDRTNWFSDEPVQFWSGISVDSEGHITELRLWGNNLSGQIPTELSHLTSLKRLYLSSNEFTGTIPEELGSLTGLERLYLGRNQLTGTMPPSLGNLTNLRRLYLSGNQLTGSIPPEIGNLTALELLYLYDNNLTGSIPPALGNLNSLKELLILGNELTGPIPPELGKMQDLQVMRIYDNQLEGPIPPELSNLGRLESLDLSSNRLTGEFPSGLVDLQKLHGLNLADNRLSGELPSQIGDFEDLVTLRLDDNQFTGSIPRELGELTTLWNLHLARNQFSSEIPQELGNLENLKRLDLSSNQLTGTIPPELGKLSISDLNLSGNQLSGAIPNAFGKLFHMNYLDLSNNQLTDTIPAELRYLGMNSFNGLEVLLGNNQLTGPVPPELGDLADLKVLEINDNLLSGQLPRELTNLKILASLQFNNNAGLCAPYDVVFQDWLKSIPQVIGDTCGSGPVETDREALVALYKATDGDNWGNNINWLSDAPLSEWYGITTDGGGRVTEIDLYLNQLSGQIPPELGELAHLKSLSIASNSSRITVNGLSSSGLTGQIPPELGKLSNLVELHLYQNDLTGEIPPELGKLVSLEELHLASNELIGEIPEELGDLRNLVELSLYQNDLTGEIPAELGNLANLEALGLYSNRLAGEIPPQLGDLGKLVELDLFQNRLTSEIPSSIGKLGNLERLSLYRNQLTGIIPSELGRLANLKYLELGENQLTGVISPELGNLTEA